MSTDIVAAACFVLAAGMPARGQNVELFALDGRAIIWICGTDAADRVHVTCELGYQAVVKINSQTSTFSLEPFGSRPVEIYAFLHAGDDSFDADRVTIAALQPRYAVWGDAGQDAIATGDQSDVLIGGPGRDRLESHGGDDWLFGGGGNDLIRSGSGDDHVNGGDGFNTLFDGPSPDPRAKNVQWRPL